MFKLTRKNLSRIVIIVVSLFIFVNLIHSLFSPALEGAKYPLKLVYLLKREFSGIIFYHRNLSLNERLAAQLGLLRSRLNQAEEVLSENARLKKLLSLKQDLALQAVACRLIAHSPDNWSSVVIVDKGALQGVRKGAVALAPAGLAGRVIEAGRGTSKVMLLNDPSMGVSAFIQRNRQEGLVSGNLGSLLTMKYLPHDADLKIGDSIITSGLTENYPKGILIGAIVEIGQEPSLSNRYALVKPAVDLAGIEELLLIVE